MARGIKKNPNRNEVRLSSIQIRLNYIELQRLQHCMSILNDDRPVSTFLRDVINSKVKEVYKEMSKA